MLCFGTAELQNVFIVFIFCRIVDIVSFINSN